jgi:hypothetical protein
LKRFKDRLDDPAEQPGVDSIRVRNPHETGRVIEAIIACL